jgi:purine/pyrimidine-nucleoside phosphorylase
LERRGIDHVKFVAQKRVRSVSFLVRRIEQFPDNHPFSNGGIIMDKFDNVTVVKKANVYFDGKVTSRTVLFANGEKKTLGIMAPGEYEFGTTDKEIMEILAGSLQVQLPGSAAWKTVTAGQTFDVPANSKFKLKVSQLTDYCCSYIK